MRITGLMIVHHLQIIIPEPLAEEVEHQVDKDLGIHKKVQRIPTLHKRLGPYITPKTVILHTSHRPLRQGVTSVSNLLKIKIVENLDLIYI